MFWGLLAKKWWLSLSLSLSLFLSLPPYSAISHASPFLDSVITVSLAAIPSVSALIFSSSFLVCVQGGEKEEMLEARLRELEEEYRQVRLLHTGCGFALNHSLRSVIQTPGC